MVIVKSSRNAKWIRRYRIFFVIGIITLLFQIYLAARFLPISKSSEKPAGAFDQTHKLLGKNVEIDDTDAGDSNSAARKTRAEDDEDLASVSKKRQHKTANVTQLRVDELDFVPACEINTKEAVSAIHRAKTQKCKQLISNITCLSQANKLYPAMLQGGCPADGFVQGKELGCFKDEKDFRLLSGYFGVNKKENSPSYCIWLCLQSGFPFAGVQYTNECFCGNDEPPSTSKIPDSSCNMKCPGNSHATCGGYYTTNIYQTGIKKFVAQTANTEIQSDYFTGNAKIVFLLTLNGRAVRQVKRLIKNLYHRDHYYYIHVDVRQDYLFRELLVLEKILPNIKLTRRRFATIWGGASLLKMLLSCMHELLDLDWKWDFVLNLSESDFPVKNITQLTYFLTANKGRNFVKSHGREVQRFIQKQGLDKTFVECETRMWRVGDRQLPMGIQVDGGSDWIALSHPFVQYVANAHPDDLVTGLLQIYNLTLLPAESFFHTVLRNSKFCTSYVDNNLHVTNWKRKLGCKCQYKHIVDWCGCSPNDFKPEDWTRITNTESRQLYFARKFEPIVSQTVILQLELWLRNMEKPTKFVRNLHGYWENIFHYQDLGVAPNDGLLTLAQSIRRRLKKIIGCKNPLVGTLLQVHSFHYKDQHKYTLFYINTTIANLELAIKPLDHILVFTPIILFKHIDLLFVGSDYDQKEQLSRNFLRVLTPYSEPVLVYQFGGHRVGQAYNFTCLWIDPNGSLLDVQYVLLDENSLMGHLKPVLKQPLLPGNWTVKLIHKNTPMLQLQFLISPLQFFSGSPITSSGDFFHRGAMHFKDCGTAFDKFLPQQSERKLLETASEANAKRRGVDLLKWIDALFTKFFKVEKICGNFGARKVVQICGMIYENCLETNWSSLAPDPKSAITIVNNVTGIFDIW